MWLSHSSFPLYQLWDKHISDGPHFSSPFMDSPCRGSVGHCIRKQTGVTSACVSVCVRRGRRGFTVVALYVEPSRMGTDTPHKGTCASEKGLAVGRHSTSVSWLSNSTLAAQSWDWNSIRYVERDVWTVCSRGALSAWHIFPITKCQCNIFE